MLGKGGALLGAAAVSVLLAGGVGAAFAIQPEAQPPTAPQPQTRVVTILDAPAPPVAPQPTTTTTMAPTAAPGQVSGSGAATITVIINRPGG